MVVDDFKRKLELKEAQKQADLEEAQSQGLFEYAGRILVRCAECNKLDNKDVVKGAGGASRIKCHSCTNSTSGWQEDDRMIDEWNKDNCRKHSFVKNVRVKKYLCIYCQADRRET